MSEIDFYLEQDTKAILKQYGVSLDDKDEQSAFIDKVKTYYEALSEPKNRVTQKRTNYNGDTTLVITNPTAEALAKTLANTYELNEEKLAPQTREVFDRYKTLIEGGYAGKDGIKTVIDNDGMTAFIDEWEAYGQEMTEKLNRLNPLAKKSAPHWHMLAAYLSPQNPEQWDIKLTTEDILTAFHSNNNDEWLKSYYTGTDSFPLSVYDDLIKSEIKLTPTQIRSIKKKFQSIGKAQEAVGKFEDKIAKANELGKLNQITDENIKARILQSLAQKNELFVASLSKAMQPFDGLKSYNQRLAGMLDNLSDGTKQLMHLNYKFNDISWQVPDEKATKDLQDLHKKMEQSASDLAAVEQRIKDIRKTNPKILKMKGSQRTAARAKYHRQMKAGRIERDQIRTTIRSQFEQIMQHSGPEVSIAVSATGSYPMSRIIEEAEGILKKKTVVAGMTLREMITKDGKISGAQILEHSVSFALTVSYLVSAWHAWESYLDDDKQEGELLGLLSANAYTTASVLSQAGTVRTAWLTASAAAMGTETHQTAVLGRLANWTTYSSTVASVLGTIGMGVRTFNAGKDFFASRNSKNLFMIISSLARVAVSSVGLFYSARESYLLTKTSIELAKGILFAEQASLEALSIAVKYIRINVYLWIAFLVIDKIWQYYKWPPVVDWASNTIWGQSDQGWSLDQHYEELSPQLVQPSLSYEVVNNQYHPNGPEESEVQLRLFLPSIMLPTKTNCKISLNGFESSSQVIAGRTVPYAAWHNLLTGLKDEALVTVKNNGCEVCFYLRSDLIQRMKLDQIQCGVSISQNGTDWHEMRWRIDILDNSVSWHHQPEMIEVTAGKDDAFNLAYPLTPWS
ncbi:hypothetical protein VA7868_04198 [Vibrio aerogenes CECT 7868]|uniref:Uncharacterized protein n=1 Tax=Vibrio aerogenes CECT 7868 TaxID=1216006 RepID=A0A1M6DDK0_9VIBR|nr:hypothetical protein [Vibrio aerogenes]SHI71273.1 hypothetical protein VA7868_04198 [Vibrio aerogenes CECT 7868]